MRILAITGLKRHGKDTTFKFLKEMLPHKRVQRFAFGDLIKEELAESLHISTAFIEAHKDQLRGLLQWWGTEYRRAVDPFCWINQLIEQITQAQLGQRCDLAVITDCRFLNEAQVLLDAGATFVRVIREGHKGVRDLHASETEMCDFQCDYTLTAGDLNELRTQVQSLITSLDNSPELIHIR
jgi:hypothetical protein